jgi:prepilin-type N-terminal cleavage/methylation domain-containing protein
MKMMHFRHLGSDLPESTRVGGFTLIELMVTITIVGILLAIGVPSFRGFVAGQRVKTASYDISSVLTYARSEALKRNADVVITPNTGGWQNGWCVAAGPSTLSWGRSLEKQGLLRILSSVQPLSPLTYTFQHRRNDGRPVVVAMLEIVWQTIDFSIAPRLL